MDPDFRAIGLILRSAYVLEKTVVMTPVIMEQPSSSKKRPSCGEEQDS